MVKTSRPVAPSALNAAMTSRRRSIWLLTALATPTPPTSSAASPNLPAGLRQRGARLVDQRRGGAIVGGVVRQLDPVDPAHQATRLQQPGSAQGGFADQESRPEADPARKLVRLAVDDAADLKTGIADTDAIAELEIEPRQQRLIHRGAECAVLLGQ
jgi:hypothetical protein